MEASRLETQSSNPQVMAVPTVMAMKNGKQIDKFVGFKNDDALDLFVDKLVQ